MPYLGNTPSENFVNVVKQDITGNGGTSYSLNHAVGSANELEVFVNNVQQEPITAYTTSGSTLTFSEAVTSTDDIYVIFRARSIGTTAPPDGSVTSAKLDTNIAVTGNLDVDGTTSLDGLTVDGDVTLNDGSPNLRLKDTDVNRYVDLMYGTRVATFRNTMAASEDMDTVEPSMVFSFKDDSETRTAMTIDHDAGLTVAGVLTAGAGSVGMGPAFFAHPASGQSISASTFTKVTLGTEVYDTDSKFASSRFTPTIAGYYQINASLTYANANFTQVGAILAIYKNGTSKVIISCTLHGDFLQLPQKHLAGQGCPKCQYKGEGRLAEIFKTKSIFYREFKIENKFYDFYLPEYNLLIERDGQQHYSEERNFSKLVKMNPKDYLKEQQKNDKLKTKLAKKEGYKIARIPYWLNKEEEEIEIDNILAGKPTYPDVPDLKQEKTKPRPA